MRKQTVAHRSASAKLNDVEPFTYLRDILQRMTEGLPMRRLDELLTWKLALNDVRSRDAYKGRQSSPAALAEWRRSSR
jgi:hypothetical protein